jgi:hypothetical protein
LVRQVSFHLDLFEKPVVSCPVQRCPSPGRAASWTGPKQLGDAERQDSHHL